MVEREHGPSVWECFRKEQGRFARLNFLALTPEAFAPAHGEDHRLFFMEIVDGIAFDLNGAAFFGNSVGVGA